MTNEHPWCVSISKRVNRKKYTRGGHAPCPGRILLHVPPGLPTSSGDNVLTILGRSNFVLLGLDLTIQAQGGDVAIPLEQLSTDAVQAKRQIVKELPKDNGLVYT